MRSQYLRRCVVVERKKIKYEKFLLEIVWQSQSYYFHHQIILWRSVCSTFSRAFTFPSFIIQIYATSSVEEQKRWRKFSNSNWMNRNFKCLLKSISYEVFCEGNRFISQSKSFRYTWRTFDKTSKIIEFGNSFTIDEFKSRGWDS